MKLRPTGRLVGAIVFLVLSLIPAVLVNSPAGYIPFLTLFISILLSFLMLLISRGKLKAASSIADGERVRGDNTGFTAELENSGLLPIANLCASFFIRSKTGEDEHYYKLFVTLSPKEKRSFSFDADFEHIGLYEAGVDSVTIYDIFGIFKASIPMDKHSSLKILPRLYRMDRLPISVTMQTESSRAVTASALGGSDYTGVREYAFGDPLKTVQWKLSAHSATLMTKQMESYTNSGVTAVLDMRVPEFKRDERLKLWDGIIESGVSVGDYSARNGIDFDMMLISGDERYRYTPKERGDYGELLVNAGMTDSGDKTSDASILLREDCASVHAQSNIVLCTAFIDSDTVSALLRLKRHGKNVIVIYLVPDTVYDKEREELLASIKSLQYAGIACTVVPSAERLVEL
jgi:uncharacterized protein (DUF58 family)